MDIERENNWLNKEVRNVYSQAGEDGIIQAALEMLPLHDKWSVEFGASDGYLYSNTQNLVENSGYTSVMIEGDDTRYKALVRNFKGNPRVQPMKAFVGVIPADNLDYWLRLTETPLNFDFLSIDIDGNDYHVWNATKIYRPKLVMIEMNPTIPNAVKFVQPCDIKVNQGSSLRSLVELANSKNYELIATTPSNALFVDEKYYGLYGIKDNRIENLRSDESLITYIFQGYDGKILIQGNTNLVWHNARMITGNFQQIPKFFRVHVDRLRGWKLALYLIYLDIHNLRSGPLNLDRIFRVFQRRIRRRILKLRD